MNQYEFMAALIDHLAWPVTTLLIVAFALFRLPWLAKFIKSIKYKDFELSIREDFTEARAVAESIEVERGPIQLSNAHQDKISHLVEIDPSIAIIEIWRKLEQEIIGLIQHNGFMRLMNPRRFIEHLVKLGKLSERDLLLFRKLRTIRNESVHAKDMKSLSKAEVFEFDRFVELLIGNLEAIKQEPAYLDLPPEVRRQQEFS